MLRPQKFIITGYHPKHRKLVKQFIQQHTDLTVCNNKLRVVEMAHSHYDVCILHPNSIFNNPNIAEKYADKELKDVVDHNIKIIYVRSNMNREKALILNAQAEYFKDNIDLFIDDSLFVQEAEGVKAVLHTYFKDSWDV
tara:strand:+ start:569 stop:985 length:417 start_codon:yes stop_codon:yes gene_type:complete